MLSDFDKKLLNLLQQELPIHPRPFAVLAERLAVQEDVVLQRVRALKDAGYLRRIGPFFDSEKLGYQGTLVALRVEPAAMASVAAAINRYPGATHNYEREGKYNLWFTLLTPGAQERQQILSAIRKLPGVLSMMNLASQKKYKIRVQFKLK